MIPALASEQETVLEALMQHSFGAQELYVPIRLKRGASIDEPCDLIWTNGGDVVLFYLTAGKKTLARQESHNLKQASRWIKRWSSTGVSLRATNRFGDILSLTFREARSVSSVSVISHPVGIVFYRQPPMVKMGFTCTIPEGLIHAITAFHGTVIDLLSVIDSYANNVGRVLLGHRKTGPERLQNCVNQLLSRADTIRHRFRDVFAGPADQDIAFVHNLLGTHRLPDPIGDKLINSVAGRKQVIEFFGDMSASDYLLLSAICVEVIKATDNQRLTMVGRTQGMHLNWHVLATSLRAKNMMEHFTKFIDSIKGTPFEHLPTIIFGYDFEGSDYRSPMMYTLPPKRGKSQAEYLIGRIYSQVVRVQSIYRL